VRVQVHFFYTCDSNLTRSEPGLGAGFIFHPQVHPKPQKIRNPEEKNRKEIKKTQKEPIYKTRLAPEPDTKADGFRCQIQPDYIFSWVGFSVNPTHCHPYPRVVQVCCGRFHIRNAHLSSSEHLSSFDVFPLAYIVCWGLGINRQVKETAAAANP
jgi:hypothetical protein